MATQNPEASGASKHLAFPDPPQTPTIKIENSSEESSSTFDPPEIASTPTSPETTSDAPPTSSSSTRARPTTSRTDSAGRALLYPQDSFRTRSIPDLRDLKADMMCNWLHQQQMERMWTSNGVEEGVILKKSKDEYRCAPEDLSSRPDGVYDAVRRLNVKV